MKVQPSLFCPESQYICIQTTHVYRAWLVECCRDGCPSGRFSHLHRGILGLFQSDHRVLGYLPNQGPSPLIAQFGRATSSRKSLGGSKFFHLGMMEVTVCLGTFNAADNLWYPSPDLCFDTILSRSSMDNYFDLMAWFLLWHSVSTVGPYIDRCVPFQIMSVWI